MDLIISNLRIPLEQDGIDEYLNRAAQKLEIGAENISIVKIISKALDI
ncbi:MAG: hypothetical protein KAS94_08855 [Desulfobulbaceae bacterium]|nr:hypothetical protein [Desulfobulbaceae bacterium]